MESPVEHAHVKHIPGLTHRKVGTVVIVDDEMMVTSSLHAMLRLETLHTVHTFNAPQEALDHIQGIDPDVVISDFSMPGMDGLTFLKAVKAQRPETTLILLTGYADKQNAIEAINEVGIYRYIEKPWDNDVLKMSIDNALERSRLISDLQDNITALTQARGELREANDALEHRVQEKTRDLAETTRKLQAILEHTADGILTLDEEYQLTWANPTAETWLKDAGYELAPQSLYAFLRVPKDALPANQALFESTLGTLPVEVSLSAIHETGREPSAGQDAFVIVIRNMTARKELERLRDDFVSTLTHDLRTPLLAAIQTLGLLLEGAGGDIPPRVAELIQMLIESNRDMLGLVNDLLEVYKYESGKQRLIWDHISITALLGHIVQELQALAQSREQSLTLALPAEDILIQGDKQELRRVFVNLLGNAIHFTPKGGHIALSLEVNQDTLLCSVKDNGRGIPAQDLPHLFQRFSQGTSKQRSSGSGLGLYLSRQIVEAHHGHIWVDSVENQGSQFYVRLPVQKQP